MSQWHFGMTSVTVCSFVSLEPLACFHGSPLLLPLWLLVAFCGSVKECLPLVVILTQWSMLLNVQPFGCRWLSVVEVDWRWVHQQWLLKQR